MDEREYPPLLSSFDAADYLKIPRQTLAMWRHKGVGPAYVKVGRRVMYRRIDLDRWIDGQAVNPGEAR